MKLPQWLNKNIISLGFVSLFADLGSEMATPLLPAFIISLGGTASLLGLIEGVANASVNFIKLFSGWYSDYLGRRKPFTVFGYACNSVGMGIIYIATHWYHILAGRVIARLGKGVREPARDSLLIESVAPRYYGRIFGFHRAMDTTGAIIGPLFAFALIAFFPIRTIFLIALIPSITALLIVLLGTQEPATVSTSRIRFFSSIRSVSKPFRSFLLASGVFGIGHFAITLMILRVTQLLTPLYGAEHTTSLTVLLYAFYNVIYAAAALPVGYLADKIGMVKMLTFGYFCTGMLACSLMINSQNIVFIGSIFLLAGIKAAAVNTIQRSMSATLLKTNTHGVGYGLLSATQGVGDLVSNSVVGFLWSTLSPIAGFGFSAFFCFLGALLLSREINTIDQEPTSESLILQGGAKGD